MQFKSRHFDDATIEVVNIETNEVVCVVIKPSRESATKLAKMIVDSLNLAQGGNGVVDSPPELIKCVQVEYDENYTGGDYSSGSASFAYIPMSFILGIQSSKAVPEDWALLAAFAAHTKLNPMHVVHYCFDELVDQYGDPWEDE